MMKTLFTLLAQKTAYSRKTEVWHLTLKRDRRAYRVFMKKLIPVYGLFFIKEPLPLEGHVVWGFWHGLTFGFLLGLLHVLIYGI